MTTTKTRVHAYTDAGTVSLRVEDCPACGIVYGFPTEFEKRRREDGRGWYCPNGHTVVYTKTKLDEAREQLQRAERERDQAIIGRTAAQDQAAAADRSRAALKDHLTRLRNRIANGVCPCCNRSFVNVRNHITGQHPEWAAEHAAVLTPAGAQ